MDRDGVDDPLRSEDPPPFGVLDELIDALSRLDADTDADFDAVAATIASPLISATVEIAGAQVMVSAGKDLFVGRSGDHSVDDRAVSRRHLRLWLDEDGALHCEDLGSANGSWLVAGEDRRRLGHEPAVLGASDRVVTIDDIELLHVIEIDVDREVRP